MAVSTTPASSPLSAKELIRAYPSPAVVGEGAHQGVSKPPDGAGGEHVEGEAAASVVAEMRADGKAQPTARSAAIENALELAELLEAITLNRMSGECAHAPAQQAEARRGKQWRVDAWLRRDLCGDGGAVSNVGAGRRERRW